MPSTAHTLFAIAFLLAVSADAQAPKDWVEGVDFRKYVGKTVIVGWDFIDPETGKQVDQDQFWGTVISSSKEKGIVIRNGETNDEWISPPFPLKPLAPGRYVLQHSKKELLNPDYEVVWDIEMTVRKRKNNKGEANLRLSSPRIETTPRRAKKRSVYGSSAYKAS